MPYDGDVTPGGPSAVRELDEVVIRKVSVGAMDNNAYLLTCRASRSQLLVDAADDPDRLLALVREGSGAARLDLVIDAPNQVFVRGRGIDAELGGQIRLTGTARNIIPIGQLELIRGRVDLLGRRFTMTEGLIELQGSLVPVIRLVAETQRDNITTRIIIDGEIRDPDITFESNPQLPEEEVLSQLLFGRGLDSISALQAAQLANAIAVLAGRGSEGIVSNLRDSVGLDDLDLTTDEEGDISVRAGKYLSDNLYTDVQVEADGTSKINLNLDVSQELTARGSVGSDGDSTVGLFYERDY